MRTVFFIAVLVLSGCKGRDSDIKESIAVNAKEQLMFAGINYSVSKGVVTLTGNCPGEELKNRAIESIRSIGGVKKVIDNITIAPVVLDTDFVLKQKVDSVLAAYATVESQVKNGVVSLRGKIKKDRVQKLLSGLSQLPVSGIENGLHVQ